ncbi:MAG: hypothetical protein GX444_16370 [Myxococcales bacterium]|nr:hypothetical protein [Myxococcales bacterium]
MAISRWGILSLLTVACLCALPIACEDKDDPAAEIPDDDDTSPEYTPPPDDDNDTPDEKWGLWHGVWLDDDLKFEDIPTLGTLSPSTVFTPGGDLAVISMRKTQEQVGGETVYRQILYLTRQLAGGEWRDPLELANFSWASQNSAVIADSRDRLHVVYSHQGQPTHLIVEGNKVTSIPMQNGPSSPEYFALIEGPYQLIHAVFGYWSLSHQVFIGDVWYVIDTFSDGSYPDLSYNPAIENGSRLVFLRYKGVGDACTLMHFTWTDNGWIGDEVLPEVDFYPRPHLAIDDEGQSNILVPSSQGLMYLTQNPMCIAGGWCSEIIAGDSRDMGQEHADLTMSAGMPVVAYRDARTSRGYTACRIDGQWITDELSGFNGGFIGLTLTVDQDQTPHLVFAGSGME